MVLVPSSAPGANTHNSAYHHTPVHRAGNMNAEVMVLPPPQLKGTSAIVDTPDSVKRNSSMKLSQRRSA